MLWLTIPGLLFITLIPAATAIVGRFPGEKLAVACFSMNSFLQVLSIWFFLDYVSKNQKKFAADTDPRIMIIISQVWLIISAGWFISTF